jgi:hypothetical protein
MAQNQAIFETIGADDPLGMWTPSVSAAATAPGAVSFSVGGDESDAPQPVVPVFRVNLPADSASAAEAFDASEQYFARVNAALENVPSRLDDLVARTQEQQQKSASDGTGAVSFDVLAFEQQETGPEGDLLALLGDAETEEKITSGEVSFGIGEPVSDAFLQAKAGFKALIEQFNREVLHYAWVETNVAGSQVARTVVDWSGDAQTVWAEGVDESQVALHNRTLKIATQTRNMRLRLFTTIAGGAAKMATLIATPGGAILALPAVYQFVTQVVAQTKQLQSIQSS